MYVGVRVSMRYLLLMLATVSVFLVSNSLCISFGHNSCNTDPCKFNGMLFHSSQRQNNHQNNNIRMSMKIIFIEKFTVHSNIPRKICVEFYRLKLKSLSEIRMSLTYCTFSYLIWNANFRYNWFVSLKKRQCPAISNDWRAKTLKLTFT